MHFDGAKIVTYLPDLKEIRIYDPDGPYWKFKIEDTEEDKRCCMFLVSALAKHAIDISGEILADERRKK